jgi:hypothetical protein
MMPPPADAIDAAAAAAAPFSPFSPLSFHIDIFAFAFHFADISKLSPATMRLSFLMLRRRRIDCSRSRRSQPSQQPGRRKPRQAAEPAVPTLHLSERSQTPPPATPSLQEIAAAGQR